MKDVARRSGVSVAAVSRFLSGDPTLSLRQETKDKLSLAVKELNYTPNPVARALRVQTTRNIAVIVSDITNSFFAEVFIGAQDAAHEKGYTLTLYNTGDDSIREKHHVDMAAKALSDGILLTSAHVDKAIIQEIEKYGLKYILVVRNTKGSNGMLITTDDSKGIKLAVSHLFENGHRKIAHISGPLYSTSGITRMEAYREAMVSYGLNCPPGYVVEGQFDALSGKNAMKVILSLPNRPTSIVAGNDLMAIGAISAIHEAGLRVPDDISVIGYDDIMIDQFITPALTTVSYNKTFLGYTAARYLIDSINNVPSDDLVRIIDVTLVERNSVKRINT